MQPLLSFFAALLTLSLSNASDVPQTVVGVPETVTDVPESATDVAQTVTDVPETVTDVPQTVTHQYYPCHRNFENCFENLPIPDLDEPEERVAFFGDRQRLEEFAEAAHNASDCMDSVVAVPACARLEGAVDTVKMWTGFLRSPGAIDAFVVASSSICVTDEDAVRGVHDDGFNCVMTFVGSLATDTDVCADFFTAYRCMRGVIAKHCGQPAGDLVKLIWNYMTRPEYSPTLLHSLELQNSPLATCEHQVDLLRRSVREAMPLIKKMRK